MPTAYAASWRPLVAVDDERWPFVVEAALEMVHASGESLLDDGPSTSMR